MKKVFFLSLFSMCLFLVSCSGPSTPGEAAKQYYGYLADGKYDKFVDGFAFDEGIGKDELKAQKTVMVSVLKEKGEKALEMKKGIKNVEVLEEDIAEGGESAKVKIKINYGDETSNEEIMSLEKQDGTWKMVQ